MTASLARYHARSPRYILNTKDNSLVRLSGPKQLVWEEKTELRDVSMTGLSFVASQDLSPQLGEVIKIQFEVPGSEQMACYAVVIRIEKINQFENSIAVHFYKLEKTQRLNLIEGLAANLKNQQNDLNQIKKQKNKTGLAAIGIVLSLMTWIVLMKFYFLK